MGDEKRSNMIDTERSKQMWPSIKLLSNNVFTSDAGFNTGIIGEACSRFYHPSKKEAVKGSSKTVRTKDQLMIDKMVMKKK